MLQWETKEVNKSIQNFDKKQIDDARKDSLNNAKYSTETLAKDSELGKVSKAFGGLFGALILFSAINDTFETIKNKNKNTWVFARNILEFTSSGVLIGYAVEKTLIGLFAGLGIGITVLIIELIVCNKTPLHFISKGIS
ncbi:MAG: hypothetical protein WC781_00545 [Candidatus Pacearchaeota archaeon]|jgi:hypothetical protein